MEPEWAEWEEEAGLVLPRDSFGLSAVGEDKLVASGVEAFDTRLMGTSDSLSWVEKASMSARRYGHGCQVGVFDDEVPFFFGPKTVTFAKSANL